jgi:hypothetical protein
MASIPKLTPGLVFRYDYLRAREVLAGVEHGKERPACILMTLLAGERLVGVTIIAEDGKKIVTDYEASGDDVIIVPIQSDMPSQNQLGVVLDITTKQYIGLGTDRASFAIVSEVNIDKWPNAGIQDVPGRPGEWAYPRPLPGPKLAEIAKAFRLLRERKLVTAIVRLP